MKEAFYGLPNEVKFCKKCVMSNQRPASAIEHQHRSDSKKITMNIDSEGICDGCRASELKEKINWEEREKELIALCDKFRRNDGSYDCLVPGSGGKDSAYAAHILKYKYGMSPLTVTWPPIMYTDYGYKNFKNWIDVGGLDNLSFNRNGKVQKLLTKLSIENLFHPFQTFIIGQKNIAPKIASKFGIDLIFYGENQAEYGNPIADNLSSMKDKAYYTYNNLDEVFLGGTSVKDLITNYNLSLNDLSPYLPLSIKELDKTSFEFHYLGYYLKWEPQEVYYYAVENTGFQPRPFRSQGTYSKYSSIDDKIDDLHYYTTFIKFGIGRATYDASHEIRNYHLTRDEGKALVKKYDGEFPNIYFEEVLGYLEIDPDYFKTELTDRFRSPHLWKKVGDIWKLRHTVNSDGTDD